jgi:hypothetical protein
MIFEKLNKIAGIIEVIEKPDNIGGQVIDYKKLKEIWVCVEPIKMSSVWLKSHNFNNQYYSFTIRTDKAINERLLLEFEGEKYHIQEILFLENAKQNYQKIIAYRRSECTQ